MKVLVLGHNGMLGNAVVKYLQTKQFNVITINARWPEKMFQEDIKNFSGDFIINCIGAFPNRGSSSDELLQINLDLPLWLSQKVHTKLILPSTDGEYSGKLENNLFYEYEQPLDAEDVYGKTKAQAFNALSDKANVRFIRTSIIGIEKRTNYSLLSWFLGLGKEAEITGYTNVLWNGITTLEWAKTAEKLIQDYSCKGNGLFLHTNLIQIASQKISKYELLSKFNDIFGRSIKIKAAESSTAINRCLFPYNKTSEIEYQLKELKKFYGL